MSTNLASLKEQFFSDCNVTEITNLEDIKKYSESKTSACWVDKKEITGGWVQLYYLSGLIPLVGVCRIDNFNKAMG